MADIDNRIAHVVYEDDKFGSVKIADDVIVCIAGLAATEVEGVSSMAGNITKDLIAKLGVKNMSRGVKLEMSEDEVSIELTIVVTYGYSIPEISAKVQDRVKSTVENMTGLHVTDVKITVAGVDTTKNR
ncbi:MAG: Asp23/Gls24 family envelope stress response protein [Eubacteriales bacterium]|nr:Asp23/Gls24 family envelope stress response protein [Eubacteriales bacterium]